MLLSEIEADCLISNIGSFLPLQTTCLPITRVTAQQPPYRASGLVHRDNLAIAAETVDARLQALLTAQENLTTKSDIESMLETLDQTVHAFSKKYENARFQSIETTRLLLSELEAEFANLAMQETQEKRINDLIQSRTDQVVDAFDFSAETEKTLKDLSARLGKALGTTEV